MTDIFVFGSNLAGRHGAGSALKAARQHGAEYGVGFGRTGNAYAIPTKDRSLRPMPLEAIKPFVDTFLRYAALNPDLTFKCVKVGTGLAGYTDWQMAPMFLDATPNVKLHHEWDEIVVELMLKRLPVCEG
jgi:hypothetical protein